MNEHIQIILYFICMLWYYTFRSFAYPDKAQKLFYCEKRSYKEFFLLQDPHFFALIAAAPAAFFRAT